MDLNCSQIITSGDYYDYIAAYTPYLYNMLSYTPGVCVNNIDNQWLVINYEGDVRSRGLGDVYKRQDAVYSLALLTQELTI